MRRLAGFQAREAPSELVARVGGTLDTPSDSASIIPDREGDGRSPPGYRGAAGIFVAAMPLDRLYIKDGVDVHGALDALNELIRDATNVTGMGGPYDGAKDRYLEWVGRAELVLPSLTLDEEVVSMLGTDRRWQIRNTQPTRGWPDLQAEVDLQVARLRRMADDLKERAQRARVAPGHITVLDTNDLLHYQWPEFVRWPEVVGQPQVRLVVPIRVVEELDVKKYSAGSDVAARARSVISKLRSVLRGRGGAPMRLRDDATIEVPLDRGPRTRPVDADEEILGACQELRRLTGRGVLLVTGDFAMELRAQQREIPVVEMPAKYRRKLADPAWGQEGSDPPSPD